MKGVNEGNPGTVDVNRRLAQEFADSKKIDYEGKHSIFGQIISQLETQKKNMSNFRIKGLNEKCYKINFKGEGSIDAGGPFRDSLTNIV